MADIIAANIIASGDWWRLESDGTLYIYCVGDMPDYEDPYQYTNKAPWSSYSSSIRYVSISSGVTSIGNYAFAGVVYLTRITIPDSVIRIGKYAFYQCRYYLRGITIPTSVTEIGYYAFSYCEKLTGVTLPDGLTTLSKGLFYRCISLTSVTIPDSVTVIEGLAFDHCTSLTGVTLPDGLTSIGGYLYSVGGWTFRDCSSLSSITLPDSLTFISGYTFQNCASLTSVTIPDNVTSIEVGSFAGCTNLTSVTIPSGVTYLSNYAFRNCANLNSITIPDSVTSIGNYTFDGCNELTDVYYGGMPAQWSVVTIGSDNAPLLSATIHYAYPPLTEGCYIGGSLSDAIDAFSLEQCPDVSYAQSVSLDGNELRSDELYITVRVRQNPDAFPASLSGVNRSTPVWYDRTDKDGNRRLEKYYWKSMERVSRYDYAITAQSPIGRLTADFPGGLYNGQPLPDIIADVIGGIVPFSVDSLLQSVRVYGWLPYTSRREALHALALASGFLIRRDNACNLFFTLPTSSSSNLPDSVIFNGGSVDYRTGQTYARVDVTAYAFLQSGDTPVTLFDNTADAAPADRLTVKFENAPCYDISATSGLTLHAYGVNHAVVSGVGVLTGRPYAVTSSILSLDGDPDADPNAVLSLSDVYLITDINAETVAQKLLSSYNAPAVVSMDFIRRAESPGDLFTFVDPYGVPRTGYLAELSGKVTSFDRVSAQFLCGYVPAWGNTYTDVLTLSGSGYWTVPDFLDGSIVRAVLVGGGQGGASGQHGTDATATGGGRGLPGKGGKILIVKLSVTAGQTFGYQCGAPGAGGVPTDATSDEMPENMTVYITPTGEHYHLNPNCNGGSYSPVTLKEARERGYTPCSTCVQSDAPYYLTNPGANGGTTTFGGYSSADGKIIAQGYNDIIHGVQYAVSGPDNGVEGGAATSGTENGNRENPGWNDVQRRAVSPAWDASKSWLSGSPGAGQHVHEVFPAGTLDEWAYGGLGGGAAVGADGPDGDDAPLVIRGGNGGDGADASAIFPPDSRSYGSGGSGGHGGGEGAVGGSAHSVASYPDGESPTVDGQRGAGGSGSSGQDGAPGCVLIYFQKPQEYLYHFDISSDNRLVLTYYTHEPPPYSVNGGHLLYTVPDGQSPPALEIQDRHLYLTEGG